MKEKLETFNDGGKKRGELIYFGTDKKAALEFAKGSWKPDEKNIVDKQKTIPMLSDGGEEDKPPVKIRFIPSAAVLAKSFTNICRSNALS